jgi:hypothetical protein
MLARTLADALAPQDSAVAVQTHVMAGSDQFTLLDAISRDFLAMLTDVVLWGDVVLANHNRVPAALVDAITPSDSAATLQLHELPWIDQFTLADLLSHSGVFCRALSDALSLTDSAEAHRQWSAGLADLLWQQDSIATVHDYGLAESDQFKLADLLSYTGSFSWAFTDLFPLTDAAVVARSWFHTTADAVSLSDLAATGHGRFATLVELYGYVYGGLFLADDNLSDQSSGFAHSEILHRLLADTLPFSDSSEVHRVWFAAVVDAFALADALATMHARFPFLIDAFALSDAVVFFTGQLSFADTIAMADTAVKQRGRVGAYLDTVTLADLQSLGLARAFAEHFPFVELFAKAHFLMAFGNLHGSSSALTRIAAKLYGASLSLSLTAAHVATRQRVVGSAISAGLTTAFAHGPVPAEAAASGTSGPYAIEGAGLQVGSFAATGDATLAGQTIKVMTGAAQAAGAAKDVAMAPCHFVFAGGASAAGILAGAINYLLRLRISTKGGSTARAQVYSPVFAEGVLAGNCALGYISRVMTTGDHVYGQSTLSGNANALVHATGLATAMQASYAEGTANYGPGRIAGAARGSGLARGMAG